MSGTSTSRARALPALGGAIDGAAATFRRFPTVLIAAAVSTAAAIFASEDLGPASIQLRLLATATLGLPLLTAVTVAGERRTPGARTALQGLALAVLAAFYLAWPGWTADARALHYVQLSAAFHLLAAVLPFARSERQNAFWQFNRALLLRFIVAGVSAATLWGGLSLALAALNKLFGLDIEETAYARLWFVFAFLFTTWYFLADVPRDLDALEEQRDYPAVLRVFAQYILTPLVAMYLVILTLYLVKVVALWDWPSGWIGWLVSGVACTGILALLLVQPIAAQPDQRWIATFARGFWLGILPAVVMLWLAIWQRVHQYGITEPRYFLAVLSVWLAAAALYFRLARVPRITMIPASLCAIAVLSLAGPWGAYAVARHSQLARLAGMLEKHGVIQGGRVVRERGALARSDAREISAAVRYLVEEHGVRPLAPWLPDTLARRLERLDTPGEDAVRAVVAAFGVPYAERGASAAGAGARFAFRATTSMAAVPVAGYDAMVPIRPLDQQPAPGDTSLAAFVVRDSLTVRVTHGARRLVDIPLDSTIARARARSGPRRFTTLPQALLRADAAAGGVRARLVLRTLEGNAAPKRTVLTGVQGYVLVGLR